MSKKGELPRVFLWTFPEDRARTVPRLGRDVAESRVRKKLGRVDLLRTRGAEFAV